MRQYKKFFEMENAKLEFTDGALRMIAQEAIRKETGARAWRGLIENYLTDLMFDLPDLPKDKPFVIDEEYVRQGEANKDSRRTSNKPLKAG